METPRLIPAALVRNNIYAVLSPISGGLAFLGNCLNLVLAIVPGLPFLCATVNGLFSLGALAAGIAGLVQVRRSGQKGKGLAITGLVLGILGLMAACLIPLLGTALWAVLGWRAGDAILVPIQ
ncbi:MAG: DUF4190 domain-containing protein [Chloroflexota bacterium]